MHTVFFYGGVRWVCPNIMHTMVLAIKTRSPTQNNHSKSIYIHSQQWLMWRGKLPQQTYEFRTRLWTSKAHFSCHFWILTWLRLESLALQSTSTFDTFYTCHLWINLIDLISMHRFRNFSSFMHFKRRFCQHWGVWSLWRFRHFKGFTMRSMSIHGAGSRPIRVVITQGPSALATRHWNGMEHRVEIWGTLSLEGAKICQAFWDHRIGFLINVGSESHSNMYTHVTRCDKHLHRRSYSHDSTEISQLRSGKIQSVSALERHPLSSRTISRCKLLTLRQPRRWQAHRQTWREGADEQPSDLLPNDQTVSSRGGHRSWWNGCDLQSGLLYKTSTRLENIPQNPIAATNEAHSLTTCWNCSTCGASGSYWIWSG